MHSRRESHVIHLSGDEHPSAPHVGLGAPPVLDEVIEIWRRARENHKLPLVFVADEREVEIDIPLDFGGYAIAVRPWPEHENMVERLRLADASRMRPILDRGNFDLLAYLTCNSRRHLQDCKDRMDWFFYIDHYLDDSAGSQSEKSEAIDDLLEGADDPDYESRFAWVNNANQMYHAIMASMVSAGLDVARVRTNTRYYFESLHKEMRWLEFTEYTNNRCYTIGMYPEVEFCFTYTGYTLTPAEYHEVYLMKHLSSYMVALQNDLFSHVKERSEQHHSNYRRYFARDEDMLISCLQAYESALRAFSALEPTRPGGALQFFRVSNQWVNGSLLWHLITSRYDENGHRIRQFHGNG